MSSKQQLAEMLAALPESLSLEETFERLSSAYQKKQQNQRQRRQLGTMAGRVTMADDFDAPLSASVLAEFEGG